MSLAIIHTRTLVGLAACAVTVEVDVIRGLPNFKIVGLPATVIKESKERVRSALINAHFEFPVRRVVVNLGPAELPKDGGCFDLPIALGILVATKQIKCESLDDYEFVGELALSGALRSMRGVLPIVVACKKIGRQLIVPKANAEEAGLADYAGVYQASHILEVSQHLMQKGRLAVCPVVRPITSSPLLDLQDVHGQFQGKRALEVAAAGKHSLLFIGPPGTGKTMLASRLPSIMPALTTEEALEQAMIASLARAENPEISWGQIPFRAPHHSASTGALVGGGRPPQPGEISRSHRGILFLDELPEFNRQTLEALREPLEMGVITIVRATSRATFPAEFQLIATMNPCPCGYAGTTRREGTLCQCSPTAILKYTQRISGPLLDRIDMHVHLPWLPPSAFFASTPNESSQTVQARVCAAIDRQQTRQGKYNSALTTLELEEVAPLTPTMQLELRNLIERLRLSARSYHRILKIARTIADLEAQTMLSSAHLKLALTLRVLDRQIGI